MASSNGGRPKRAKGSAAPPLWTRGVIVVGAIVAVLGLRVMIPRRAEKTSGKAILVGQGAPTPENPKTAFEPTDWSVGPVALIYTATLSLLVICCFVLIAAYPNSLPDVGRTLRIAPPGPRLQTNPLADLARFQAEEERRLDTYYWIDKQKGVVHIPIEQAMKELVSRGISGFPKAPQ